MTVYWSRRPTLTEDDIAVVNTFARDVVLALAQPWNDDGLNLTLEGRKPLRQTQGAPSERNGLDRQSQRDVTPMTLDFDYSCPHHSATPVVPPDRLTVCDQHRLKTPIGDLFG